MRALKFLFPSWYAVPMGLAGLALAWHRATPMMGDLAGMLALGVGALTALVYVILLGATALRGWQHADAWREDRQHPVRHTFVAALPIATLLVATVAVALLGPHPAIEALWWAGAVGQVFVTVWVLSRWWGKLAWPSVTPALFIPIVGNVLAPLAGVPLGHADWSAAQFGIGLLFWPVVLVLIVARTAVHGLWPERMRPTTFIFIAPPAAVGLSVLQMGAPPILGWMCWGMAMFSFLWVATQARQIAAMPFSMPHWGLSFPLAALAALTLRLSSPGTAMAVAGVALLALASLVILGLLFATVRGLRDGSLLAPEPVAAVVAAPG
jgi:tellurite resistance protein